MFRMPAERCGFVMVDSDRGSGAATPGRCLRCSVRDWQPPRIGSAPTLLEGIFVGTPPAQAAFSPLLLSVQGVQHCWIGSTSLDRKHSRRRIVHAKDAEGSR